MSDASPFDRFKERKIVQWALAYGAGAISVAGVIEVAAEPWGISPEVQQAIHILLLFGLLATLVLAWNHGERGRQRVSVGEALILGVLLLTGGFTAWNAASRPPADSTPPLEGSGAAAFPEAESGTIAVLAFDDQSSAGDQAFFAEGMTEEIMGALSRVPGLRVAARTSAFSFQGTNADAREIGGRLGVRHVLDGSVLRDGSQVRIYAQLIDARDGFEIWSQSFTRELTSVIEIQEEIARTVAAEILPQLGDLPASMPGTSSAEAHLAYLRGRYHWHRVNTRAAIAAFDEAIALDSAYAGAWAGLGTSLTVLAIQDPELRDRAVQAVDRAIFLDPRSADALSAKARADLTFRYDWDAAEMALERAVSLDPSHIETRHWYSHVLSWTQRAEQGVAQAEEALRLDPLSPFMNLNLGAALRWAGRLDEALAQIGRAIELEPDFAIAHYWLWDARIAVGDLQGATQALVRWAEIEDHPPELAQAVGDAIEEAHRTGSTQRLEEGVLDDLGLDAQWTRRVYAELGQDERALQGLLQAYEVRSGAYDILSLRFNDLYPGLRGDPRFEDLVMRIGPGG